MGRLGLDALVAHYLEKCWPNLLAELESFAKQDNLAQVVRRASYAETERRTRFAHQRRIRRTALEASHRALAGRIAGIETADDFSQLYDLVNESLKPVSGVGALFVYDAAKRIGAFLGLEVDRVHLHAGTRVGALRLGLPVDDKLIAPEKLSGPLGMLTPVQVEDFLCIYKDAFPN